jgi:hypothetical protein
MHWLSDGWLGSTTHRSLDDGYALSFWIALSSNKQAMRLGFECRMRACCTLIFIITIVPRYDDDGALVGIRPWLVESVHCKGREGRRVGIVEEGY